MAKKKTEDAPEELSAEAQAVVDAEKKVADAKETLAAAQAEHVDAVAEHAAAVKAAQPVPNPEIHIMLDDGRGGSTLLEHPEAKEKMARMTVGGRNVEHVAEGENGVWIYRSM